MSTTTILAEYNGNSGYGLNCEHRLVERDGQAYLVIVRHNHDGPKKFVGVVPPEIVKRVVGYINSPNSPAREGFVWPGLEWLREHEPMIRPLPPQDDNSWVEEL